jgi:Bacterial Ig domain
MPLVSRRVGRLGILAGIGLGAFVLVSSTAAPAGAQTSGQALCPAGAPVVQLANPSPGDLLPTGDIVISGVAFDPAATDGSGISRVDVFLGQRDSGGLFLGSAVPAADTGSTSRTFSIKANLPSGTNGGRDFVAYAISGVDGQQTSVTIPVFVGAPPTPTPVVAGSTARTPVPLTAATESTCRTGTTLSPAAPSADIGPGFRRLPLPPTGAAPVLELANPASGGLLTTGEVIVEGVAYDPSTPDGAGIDRVELFLDSRDSGGLSLGSAVPGMNDVLNPRAFRIRADIPGNTNGGHSLVAYAHSAVTGQETVVTVREVYFGAPPTPTPRPTS